MSSDNRVGCQSDEMLDLVQRHEDAMRGIG